MCNFQAALWSCCRRAPYIYTHVKHKKQCDTVSKLASRTYLFCFSLTSWVCVSRKKFVLTETYRCFLAKTLRRSLYIYSPFKCPVYTETPGLHSNKIADICYSSCVCRASVQGCYVSFCMTMKLQPVGMCIDR
jgi:hypothetical protein